nr:unnamed protein product [Digitaria exilis]
MNLTACTPCTNKLVVGKPLSPGDVVVFSEGAFALGFFSFSPSNSTPANLYLGIWYNSIPKQPVVPRPIVVTGRSSTSTPTLSLTNAGGRVVWLTEIPRSLTNSRNLEARSPMNSTMLWQSSEHPNDTLLPDMKIRASRGGRPGSRRPVAEELFAYGIDQPTSLQLFTSPGTDRARSGAATWTGYRSTSTTINLTVLDVMDDDASMSFTLSPGGTITRYVMMSYSGELVLRSWNAASVQWDELAAWPPYECSRYGPFGYCNNTVVARGADVQRRGVEQREALRCGDEDGFLELPAMKAPDRFVVVGNRSFDECRRNCSCVALAYANLSSSSKGAFTRCLVWAGELIDAEKIGAKVTGSETLHLRLGLLPCGPVQDDRRVEPCRI